MIPLDLFGHEDPEEYAARRQRELYEETEKITYPSHEALAEAIRSCSRCPLRKEGGLGPVLSTGPSDSPLMIVGAVWKMITEDPWWAPPDSF